MIASDGRRAVALDGGIYNGAELRERLVRHRAAPRHGWQSNSDAETVLHAMATWGAKRTLASSNGAFALAYWDGDARRLTLARDRLGERLLFVTRVRDGIAFASELKALERLPGFDAGIDPAALECFLVRGFIPVPATIYRSTTKLVPGAYVTVSPEAAAGLTSTGDFLAHHREHYWRLHEVVEAGLAEPFRGTPEDAIDELDRLLSEAVRLRSRVVGGEAPGAFLSGGIDSSTVVALLQANSTDKVRTFSIGFEEGGYDESSHAAAVAAHLGTSHSSLIMSSSQALDRLPSLPEVYDEPFADSSQVPSLLLSELARRHVGVAFSGDGGDEFFAGYGRYDWTESTWRRVTRIPFPVRGAVAGGLRLIAPRAWDRLAQVVPRHYQSRFRGVRIHGLAAEIASRSLTEFYVRANSAWPADSRLLVEEPAPSRLCWTALPEFPTVTETLMFRDTLDALSNDVLTKVGRAAASVSLDVRAPLLDPDVMAFAWRLPLSHKRFGGTGKLTLRRLLHRYVPPELVERPKAGFAIPLGSWLRGPLRDWGEVLLRGGTGAQTGLRVKVVRRLWEAHQAGREEHAEILWNVLTLLAWQERARVE